MKYKSRPLTPNKYPKKELHCVVCDKLMDRSDLKFGCARCEWRSTGTDLPAGHKASDYSPNQTKVKEVN